MSEMIPHLAQAASLFAPYTGAFDEASLRLWLREELDDVTDLRASSLGNFSTRFLIPQNIVHIISGNTPHAAWQSLLCGLLLGTKNRLKLPSDSLLDFEQQLSQLPAPLQELIETSRTLPSHWLPEAGALVVYGNDATIRHFQTQAPLEIPFIAHGHRLGIALIDDPSPEAAQLAAHDIGQFDQQGCLSLQTIYLEDPLAFAPLLANAMTAYEQEHPRLPLSPSEHGAITNLRHETRYLAAQEPEKYALWHNAESTAWTIIYQDTPGLAPSPLGRTVFLKPLAQWHALQADLSSLRHLSGIGLHPFQERNDLPSPRLFPLGNAQAPPFAWAHDGLYPLRSLIKVQTLG